MAKNDVDKLHEQKAERGVGRREGGRKERGEKEGKNGGKKQTRRLAPKPRGMGRYTGVQNRGGKDGRDGRGRGRNNEGVILEN